MIKIRLLGSSLEEIKEASVVIENNYIIEYKSGTLKSRDKYCRYYVVRKKEEIIDCKQ